MEASSCRPHPTAVTLGHPRGLTRGPEGSALAARIVNRTATAISDRIKTIYPTTAKTHKTAFPSKIQTLAPKLRRRMAAAAAFGSGGSTAFLRAIE